MKFQRRTPLCIIVATATLIAMLAAFLSAPERKITDQNIWAVALQAR